MLIVVVLVALVRTQFAFKIPVVVVVVLRTQFVFKFLFVVVAVLIKNRIGNLVRTLVFCPPPPPPMGGNGANTRFFSLFVVNRAQRCNITKEPKASLRAEQ